MNFILWIVVLGIKIMLEDNTTKQSMQSFSGNLQISIFAGHGLLLAQFWTAYFHKWPQNQAVSRHESERKLIFI